MSGFMVLPGVLFVVVHFYLVVLVLMMFMAVIMGLLWVFVTDGVAAVLSVWVTLLMIPHFMVVFVVFVLVAIVIAASHFFMFKLGSMLNAVVMLLVRTQVFVSHNCDSKKMSEFRLLLFVRINTFLIRI